MHVVFTPSWYPDRNRPHKGSFFRDQARMLQRSGMRVGVIALEPVSFWQARRELTVDVEEGIVVVRGTVPTLTQDRYMAPDLAAAAALVASGALTAPVTDMLPGLGAGLEAGPEG